MNEQTGELDIEKLQDDLDGWYRELLTLEDLEADLAMLKLAHLSAKAAAARTRVSRSSSRASVGFLARELDPFLLTLLSHARLLERAMSIRRHKPS